jgi:hypothetical protein
MNNRETSQIRKQGSGQAWAIGCLSALVVAGLLGYLAYRGVMGKISEYVDQYTDKQSQTLPQVVVSENEAKALNARIDQFKEGIKTGSPIAPLILSGDDINKLIHSHPDWKELAGKVYVRMSGDKMEGDVSFPLTEIGGPLKGRYLNGSAAFTVHMTAGRLMLFVESVTVKGKALPEEFMKEFRSKNLAEDTNKDGKLTPVLNQLESISVANSHLQIIPRNRKK